MEKATTTAARFEAPRASIDSTVSQPSASDVVIHDEAASYRQRHALQSYLQQCLDLVAAHFRISSPINVCVQSDPEFSDEWLEIDISADGDVDSVSAAYDAYTRDWLDATPGSVGRQIRLSIGLT